MELEVEYQVSAICVMLEQIINIWMTIILMNNLVILHILMLTISMDGLCHYRYHTRISNGLILHKIRLIHTQSNQNRGIY